MNGYYDILSEFLIDPCTFIKLLELFNNGDENATFCQDLFHFLRQGDFDILIYI